MKNFKVSKKLITSFLIVIVLTGIVGGVGVVGMLQMNNSLTAMYTMQTVPMPYMAEVQEMIQRQNVCMQDMVIGAALNDMALVEDAKKRSDSYHDIVVSRLDPYRETIKDADELAIFDEARKLYDIDFAGCKQKVYEAAKNKSDARAVYAVMTEYNDVINTLVDDFELTMNMKVATAAKADADADVLLTGLLIVILVVLAFAIVVSIGLALYISGLISKPLVAITNFMQRASTSGDITISESDEQLIKKLTEAKDEIGQLSAAMASYIMRITEVSNKLESMAGGDLTIEVKTLSDVDTIGKSLKQTIDSLNDMFSEIKASSDQVSTGAQQVADGSQALAQGSTEQAASIEELSSSIADISEKTKTNAETADKTAKLSNRIKESAEKGSHQMDEMIKAVDEINTASNNISKIIKTIDDIAFQTNILALNAAVEAARAGQHGKGFAVVAEEVRNLASKSAEAAKETGIMIQDSMEKAEIGARIAGETAASLAEIVSGVNESSRLITEITDASGQQSLAIAQINTGIDQVTQVVQTNSATAEESAATAEEMNSQSNLLQEYVSKFKLKNRR